MANQSQTSGRLPLKEWRQGLGRRIEKAFPMVKIDPETYMEEFTVLAEEVGRERTEQAVTNAIRMCRYPPTIAEIRNCVPAKKQPAWKTPTEDEMAEAEDARKSPEAQEFFNLLRKIKTEKRGGEWKQATK